MLSKLRNLLEAYISMKLTSAIEENRPVDVERLARSCRRPGPHIVTAIDSGRRECAQALARALARALASGHAGHPATKLACDLQRISHTNVRTLVTLLHDAGCLTPALTTELASHWRRDDFANALVATGAADPDMMVDDETPLWHLVTGELEGFPAADRFLRTALETGASKQAEVFARMLKEPLSLTCSPRGTAPFAAMAACEMLEIVVEDLAGQQSLVDSELDLRGEHSCWFFGMLDTDHNKSLPYLPALRRLCRANPGLRLENQLQVGLALARAARDEDTELLGWLAANATIGSEAATQAVQTLSEEGFQPLRWLCENCDLSRLLDAGRLDTFDAKGARTVRYLTFLSDMIELGVPAGEYAARYRQKIAGTP